MMIRRVSTFEKIMYQTTLTIFDGAAMNLYRVNGPIVRSAHVVKAKLAKGPIKVVTAEIDCVAFLVQPFLHNIRLCSGSFA